jgi:hypothetical protein
MPSAKARAAKAATAARVATYEVSAGALDSSSPLTVTGIVGKPEVNVSVPGLRVETNLLNADTMCGALSEVVMPGAFTAVPFQPAPSSVLNVNTSPDLNRALSVGAIVRNTGKMDNASDEENVQPPGAVASPVSSPVDSIGEKGTYGRLSRPLSPILGNRDNERDVRAFEVERQKVKRAGELAKRKAKKAAKAGGRATVIGGHGRGSSESGMDSWWKSKAGTGAGTDMDIDVEDIVALANWKANAKKIVSNLGSPMDRKKHTRIGESDAGIEVNLSELFAHSHKKPRKVKGMFPRFQDIVI